MTTLAPTLQAFFVNRLGRQRDASPHTVDSYRHAFRLLLTYAEAQTGKGHRHGPGGSRCVLVSGFLDHLEDDRGSSVASRNTRLAAIHSFFRFASYRHPEHAQAIQQVLAIPARRPREAPVLPHQHRDGRSRRRSRSLHVVWRRDHVLLVVALRTGLRLSELTGLRCRDVELGATAHVKCLGKGRKRRDTRSTNRRSRFCAPGWLSAEANPTIPCFLHARRSLSPDAVQRLVAKHVATHGAPVPASPTRRSAHTISVTAARWTYFETASTSQCWQSGLGTRNSSPSTRISTTIPP